MMQKKWVEEEMAELSTGDKRLNKRAKSILQNIMDKPAQPFTQQFQSAKELKACYRFFDSDSISHPVVMEPHYKRTIERISVCKIVVIPSDSTSLNYSTRSSNPDSGYISSNNAQGFLMHTSLATTLDRQPLGIVSTKFWARSKEKPAKKIHRDYLPITEKESYKWIESFRAANEISRICKDTQIINVADREADILELWEEAIEAQNEENGAYLIVRCNHDRLVTPTEQNNSSKLFEFGKNAPVSSHCEFEIKDRATHKIIRKVKQEIRASSVCISPAYRPGVEKKQLNLNLVFMQEIECPDGIAPICWCLLTTLPIEEGKDIEKIVQAYLARWDIEILFRTFKTGCRVEERSLRTSERLWPMFGLFLVVAWRINSLSRLSRVNPDLPCTVIFSEVEWRAAYAALYKSVAYIEKVPTIREMLIVVARLGGYLNRKNDPEPGAQVIWRGLEYLRVFLDAWELMSGHMSPEDNLAQKRCG